MTSLFRSLIKENSRETNVKELLIKTLSENAREIQFEYKENGKDYLELTDTTNSLCTTLEAIFLHGLKDTLLWQTINVISGDVDRRPEPSFWPILLVFLHKQVIEQIHSLSQITTEIGYCRSWIRLSLNDSLFSSYLNNIKKNSSALKPYYKNHALLRDSDNIEVASKIVEGVETCVQINLPVNSSLLNQWMDYALQLAGIWSPPLKSCPIASGVDVASSITNTVTIPTPKPLQTNEVFSESIANSPFKTSVLENNYIRDRNRDHDCDESGSSNNLKISDSSGSDDLSESEHLRILLQKVDEMGKISEEENKNENDETAVESSVQLRKNSKDSKKRSKRNKAGLSLDINATTRHIGNSVMPLSGWSIHDEDSTENNNLNSATTPSEFERKREVSRSDSMTMSTSSVKSHIDRNSYNTLLVRHQKSRQLDWNDVWARFQGSIGITGDVVLTMSQNENATSEKIEDAENIENLGFEVVVAQTLSEKFSIQELQNMVRQTFQLGREKGLDSQGFVCKSCPHPLGVGYAPAQVCAFSGNYYCSSCINLEPILIPAKIIYNWDFHKYIVSKRAALFLMEFQNQLFFDLKLLNPDLYTASEEMATLQSLRIKLNFIRAYLFTCRESIIEDLQKQVWPREYLYEHIHQYSVADLTMIQKGTLAQLLQKTVNFGEEHILNCRLCSVKGFICEICNSLKVLYPFHIDTTFRCEICGAVFHANCLNDSQPCPKCERRRRREDLPLLEAVDML